MSIRNVCSTLPKEKHKPEILINNGSHIVSYPKVIVSQGLWE